MKNRIILGLICIIVSLIICFGLTPLFNDALKAKVEIVRVNSEIKTGEEITVRMVTMVEVGAYNLPSNLIYKMEDVVGQYAIADFQKGDYILTSKISAAPILKNEYLTKLNGENRAISVSIKSFAAGLSGKLENGDIISLIANDVGMNRETLLLPELQYVEIIATTTSSGKDNDVQEQGEDTDLASTITLLASPEQSRLLAELERNGSLHAVLVYRGNTENARLFLDEQNRILEELSSEATDSDVEDGMETEHEAEEEAEMYE